MREKLIESQYGDHPRNFHVTKIGDTLEVELTYPPWSDTDNAKGQCRHVVVNQASVRASDGLRLTYDYDRDGWSIQQASTFSWDVDDASRDPDWQEVAFVQSWARERDTESTAPAES